MQEIPNEAPQRLITTGSIDELLRLGSHKARLVGDHIHIYNVLTGIPEFILLKNSPPGARTALIPKQIDNNLVYVQEEITGISHITPSSPPYSDILIDLICEKIVHGDSMKKVCSTPGMPSYSVLCSWRRTIPGVEERIARAREDRGEYLRDKAMEALEEMDEDNVAAQTAKHKGLVWAAGVDHNRYSPKAKIEASISTPTQILVYTGIGGPDGAAQIETDPIKPTDTGVGIGDTALSK